MVSFNPFNWTGGDLVYKHEGGGYRVRCMGSGIASSFPDPGSLTYSDWILRPPSKHN